MATVFDLESVAVSGTLGQVFLANVEGCGDIGVLVSNAASGDGGQAFSAAIIDAGPASGGPFATLDSTTFASLAAGSAAFKVVDPNGLAWLRMRATSAGTTVRAKGTDDYESSA